MNGYKVLCEFFSTGPHEKILKKYPFISVEIYKGKKLETKKRIFARLIITDKKLIIDGLSTFVVFPFPKSTNLKKYKFSDTKVIYEKVKEFEIPYEYLSGIEYDEEIGALKIQTLLDKNLILLRGRNIEKISQEIIDIVSKVTKKYIHLTSVD